MLIGKRSTNIEYLTKVVSCTTRMMTKVVAPADMVGVQVVVLVADVEPDVVVPVAHLLMGPVEATTVIQDNMILSIVELVIVTVSRPDRELMVAVQDRDKVDMDETGANIRRNRRMMMQTRKRGIYSIMPIT